MLLLFSVQCWVINQHGHYTHTVHMVSNGFRLLDAIIDPARALGSLIESGMEWAMMCEMGQYTPDQVQ